MSGIEIPKGLLQRYYNLVSSGKYTPAQIMEMQELLSSKLAQVLHHSIKKLDKTLSIPNLLKAFLDKPDSIAKRSVYGELRKVINLINSAIHRYGYISTEIFSRFQINQYIGLLQKAGYAVNEIREKVNIAQLHKQLYGFMDSMDIKLNNPKLFATTSRVTVIESADMDTRKAIQQIFRDRPTEIYNLKDKVKTVYVNTEIADIDDNISLVRRRLKQLGFGERINVSNNPAKPYWRSLDDYAQTWIEDTQSRAAFLTTTHLCEATGMPLVQWLASPTCCDDCQRLDNRIFSLDPDNNEFPYLAIEPPVHPHCNCLTIPYIQAFEELSKDMRAFYNDPEPMTASQHLTAAKMINELVGGIITNAVQ